MRLVEPLDLREHEVCRNVKTLRTSSRLNVKLPVEFARTGSVKFKEELLLTILLSVNALQVALQ